MGCLSGFCFTSDAGTSKPRNTMCNYIWEQDRCAQNDCPNPIGTPRVTGWKTCRHAGQNSLPHQCPRFNPAGVCSTMRPVSFCSQRCAMNSLEEVFQGIDKLKEGALELETRQNKALKRSRELSQRSDALKNMATQTMLKWSRNTGQPPKAVPPKRVIRKGRHKIEIPQDSEDSDENHVGEDTSDDMEWETDAPSGGSGGPSGMDGFDGPDDLGDFDAVG
ncbi:hypothetical protein F5B21DRAFT_523330 [Xylaria acuta]|nr:hypothetical protein F5B21DRAFT_523330 [Xylaria acuta]